MYIDIDDKYRYIGDTDIDIDDTDIYVVVSVGYSVFI